MFFKAKPNLPDHEKARVELHMQHLAESFGAIFFASPFLIPDNAFGHDPRDLKIEDIVQTIGQHLGHDVSELNIHHQPEPLKMCGGGG